MNVSTIKAGLATLFARLSTLPAHSEDQDTSFPADLTQAILTFRLTSVLSLGQDELRKEYDPDLEIEGDTSGPGGTPQTGGIVYTSSGNREVLCSVLIECGRTDVTAHFYLEKVRTGLNLPGARRELKALGLGVQRIGQSRDVSYDTDDYREMGAAVLEIRFNAADWAEDAPVTTIQSVEITQEYTD